MTNLTNITKIINKKSDLYGIANFQKNKKELVNEYGEDICKYPNAISIAIKLNKEIIDHIPETKENEEYAKNYLDEYFNSHKKINKIADEISKQIEEIGYNAIPIYVSGENEKINLTKRFSHKTTANLAGLGWLGRNALFITKEFGPRLTWVTILTDAPFETYQDKPLDPLCGDCTCCMDICPSGAITHEKKPSESYNPKVCGNYIKAESEKGHSIACGLCLYICPHGRNE
ncbi:MAG: hypothetical protein Q4Q23_04370 [Methanobacteriaceae archaeon]|nr:hypothetical protein [Methanobacteriaceae archaeon]